MKLVGGEVPLLAMLPRIAVGVQQCDNMAKTTIFSNMAGGFQFYKTCEHFQLLHTLFTRFSYHTCTAFLHLRASVLCFTGFSGTLRKVPSYLQLTKSAASKRVLRLVSRNTSHCYVVWFTLVHFWAHTCR